MVHCRIAVQGRSSVITRRHPHASGAKGQIPGSGHRCRISVHADLNTGTAHADDAGGFSRQSAGKVVFTTHAKESQSNVTMQAFCMQVTAGPHTMHASACESNKDRYEKGQQNMVTDDLRCGLFEPADEPARPGNDTHFHDACPCHADYCMQHAQICP